MTNEEKSHYNELKSCFKRLKSQLDKYHEGSSEYDLIFEDLSSISIEMSKIRNASKNDTLNSLKDMAGNVILGDNGDVSVSKSKTR